VDFSPLDRVITDRALTFIVDCDGRLAASTSDIEREASEAEAIS